MNGQADLFGAPMEPEGLRLEPALVDSAEETALLARTAGLPFEAFDFHGFKGHRRVIYFGARYDFSRGRLEEAEPLPGWLAPLRARAEAFAGLVPEALTHCLITEYRPGAGIGWHRDRPQFGQVVGVSLGAGTTMRFRRERPGGGWDRVAVPLPPRSAYLLTGPAREDWQHSICPGERLRVSVTFRTLR